MLEAILAGASSLSILGGGTTNASSRLYKALVETELATDVGGSCIPTMDPYLYGLSATVRQGHTPQEVEAAFDREIDRIVNEPVQEAELAKALKQARAAFAYGSESVTNQGFRYGWSEVFADYKWFETYLDRLAAVTVEDVQRVAQKVLRRSNRVVGTYLPKRGTHAPKQSRHSRFAQHRAANLSQRHDRAGKRKLFQSIVVPRVKRADGTSVPGNPVMFDAALREEWLAGGADLACRKWRERNPDRVRWFDTDNHRYSVDIDTPEDLERFAASTGQCLVWPAAYAQEALA